MNSKVAILGVMVLFSCMTSIASAQNETNVPAPTAAPTPTEDVKAQQLADDLKEFEEFKRWREAQRKAKEEQAQKEAAAPAIVEAPKETPVAEAAATAPTQSPAPAPIPVVETPKTIEEQPLAPEPKIEDPKTTITESQPSHERAWKFAIGYGIMVSSGELEFKDARASDGTNSGDLHASMGLKKENSMLMEVQYLKPNSWGFIGGIKFEDARKIESITVSSGNNSATLTAGSDSALFRFTTYHVNAVYMWDKFYLPFGLNYSLVTLENLKVSGSYRTETMGLYGSQVGLGYMVTPSFAVELTSWTLAVDQYLRVKNDVLDFNEGLITSTLLSAKFRF